MRGLLSGQREVKGNLKMNKVMRFLLALVTMFVCASSWASGGTFYGRVTAKTSPVGAGMVYVGTSNTPPTDSQYKEQSLATNSKQVSTGSSASVEFYVYAKPAAGYKFSKWTVTDGDLGNASQALGCKVTVTASGTSDSPTEATVTANFEPLPKIPVPTAVAGLVYDGTAKTGVNAGTGYTLTGNTATAAGGYTAMATLAAGYLWEDGSDEPKPIPWSINPKPVTVTANDSGKTFGEKDPATFAATVVGTLGTDTVSYTLTRVAGEDVGTWAIVPTGETEQGNYAVSFANGTFTIVPRPILVSVAAASKYYGEADPEFKWTVSGTEAFPLAAGGVMPNGQTVELKGTLIRTAGEDVKDSPYDIDTLTSFNEGNNPNYVFVEQLDGEDRFTILPRPTIGIRIAKGEGVSDVQTNGVSVVGELELPADATEVGLELVSTNTIPIFKFKKNDGDWGVTNKTPVIAVVAGDALMFTSEEAKVDDPAVTPEQTKQAIIDAIDEGPNKEIVAQKVNAVVDISDEPADGKVSAKEMAKWITDNTIKSADMAASGRLVASVKLNTSVPITEGNTEIEFVKVEEASSEAFTFDLLMFVGEKAVEMKDDQATFVASCILTTGDLAEGFGGTVDASRVKIRSDGKVTITPDPGKTSEFFRVFIP